MWVTHRSRDVLKGLGAVDLLRGQLCSLPQGDTKPPRGTGIGRGTGGTQEMGLQYFFISSLHIGRAGPDSSQRSRGRERFGDVTITVIGGGRR